LGRVGARRRRRRPARSGDPGEGDGIPTLGEPNFDRTDLNESDQIGLTGFKLSRIVPGEGNPSSEVDNIWFFTDENKWPERLYQQFTDPDPSVRFGPGLASNYNIAFLFASGPFDLAAGQTERFSLALAYGADLTELAARCRPCRRSTRELPFRRAADRADCDRRVGRRLRAAELGRRRRARHRPGHRTGRLRGIPIYRSTDPDFRDPKVIFTGTGSEPIYNGRPIAQFDLIDGISGYSEQSVEGWRSTSGPRAASRTPGPTTA